MRTRCSAPPLEVVLDRRAWVRRTNEFYRGHANPLLAIPELDSAEVAFKIDGGSFDEDGVARGKTGAVFRFCNDEARLGNSVVTNEHRRPFMGGVNVEIGAWCSARP